MQKSSFLSKCLLATVVALSIPTINFGMNPNPAIDPQIRAQIGLWLNAIAAEIANQRAAMGNIVAQGIGAGLDGMNQAAQDPAFKAGLKNAFQNGMGGAFEGIANGWKDPNYAQGFTNMAEPFQKNGEATKAFNRIGDTIHNFQTKVFLKPMLKAVGIGILAAGGTAGAYYGTKALIDEWQRSRKRPQIIIETSYRSYFQRIKDFFSFGKKQEQFDMIFPANLQTRLDEISKATKNINEHINQGKTNVKYRNVLLYGKPGTGKTMFARKLAHECGMEFAMMSGSSFTKQGALEEMDHLFKWANNSNGLLLFIDEAEAFLLKRENMKTDSYEYKVLTNFLNYTGTRSGKFMIVMATNRLSQIDSAIYRRVDDLVEIPLPGESERARVLKLYRDKILLDASQNGEEFVSSAKRHMSDSKIKEMATATAGLSNGDLEGIINSIKTSSDITSNGLVGSTIVDTAVQRYIQKQKEFENAAKNEAAAAA